MSGSRSKRTVGSSSMIRWEAWEIRSSSARVLGSMAKEIDGSGNLMGGMTIPAPLAQSVSPVAVTFSLAVATMSPALACPAGTCSFPWRKKRPPSFSSASLVGVGDRRVGIDRAREDPHQGDPAGIGVGDRLEDEGGERGVRRTA